MKQIYKYQWAKFSLNSMVFNVPKDTKILHVNNQDDCITIWMEVETSNPPVSRRFFIITTGSFFTAPMTYVGTVFFENNTFVVHVYEEMNQ